MFAKTAVFFFALVAFVDAAPVNVDYTINPGVSPLHPIKVALPIGDMTQPVALKRALPLEIGADIGIDVLKRDDSAELDFAFNAGAEFDENSSMGISGKKRETIDADTFVSRLLDSLESHGLNNIHVNKPLNARSPDDQTLSQLQAFVDNTVHLLHALRRSDVVDTFLTNVNNLKAEAGGGTLNAGDLMDAVHNLAFSVL
jgi:hypothetical protein